MNYDAIGPRADPDEPDDLTADDFKTAFAWLPFDWRWLLAGWAIGFVIGVAAVLWFLVFIAGPIV